MNRQELLLNAIKHRNWNSLTQMLGNMTNSEFRRVQRTFREEILPALPQELFWETYFHLVSYKPQAFITGIEAINHICKHQPLNIEDTSLQQLAKNTTREQARTIISIMLSQLADEQQISALLKLFRQEDEQQAIQLLIHTPTPAARYTLFKLLKQTADNKQLALLCCTYFIKKGDDQSLNMASILQAYFGLHEITRRLPLNIQPYELSRLDQGSFDTFKYMLEGKTPRL